jgi:hypothetical protein
MLNKIEKLIKNATDDTVFYKGYEREFVSRFHQDFRWRMHPYTHEYYFEASPMYSFQLNSIDKMQKFPILMFRDGLITLLEFFLKNPKPPERFITKILVNKKFESFVPKYWKDSVATYELYFSPPKADQQIEKVYISGMIYDYNTWLQSADKIIEKLNNLIPQGAKCEFIMPIKDRPIFNEVNEIGHIVEFLAALGKSFKRDYKVISDVSKMFQMKYSKDAVFCSLTDEPFILGDNYHHQVFANKGMGCLDQQKIDLSSVHLSYDLSFNHKVIIRELGQKKDQFSDIFFELRTKGIKPYFSSVRFHKLIKEMILNKEIIC